MARQGLLLLLALCGALAAASHTPKIYTHRARLVFEVPNGVHVETTVPTTQAGDGPTQVSTSTNKKQEEEEEEEEEEELTSCRRQRQDSEPKKEKMNGEIRRQD